MSFQPDIPFPNKIQRSRKQPFNDALNNLREQNKPAKVRNTVYIQTFIGVAVLTREIRLLVPANPKRVSLTLGTSYSGNVPGKSTAAFFQVSFGYPVAIKNVSHWYGFNVATSLAIGSPFLIGSYYPVSGTISVDDIYITRIADNNNFSVIAYEGVLAVDGNERAA